MSPRNSYRIRVRANPTATCWTTRSAWLLEIWYARVRAKQRQFSLFEARSIGLFESLEEWRCYRTTLWTFRIWRNVRCGCTVTSSLHRLDLRSPTAVCSKHARPLTQKLHQTETPTPVVYSSPEKLRSIMNARYLRTPITEVS